MRRQVKRRNERKAKLDAIKLKKGCFDCGYNKHPDALDFDHLPGCDKVMSIARLKRTSSWKTLLKEIRKCEVVCANCHRIREASRRVTAVATAT